MAQVSISGGGSRATTSSAEVDLPRGPSGGAGLMLDRMTVLVGFVPQSIGLILGFPPIYPFRALGRPCLDSPGLSSVRKARAL